MNGINSSPNVYQLRNNYPASSSNTTTHRQPDYVSGKVRKSDASPMHDPSLEELKKFNNTPSILARGTRTVEPGSINIMLTALKIKDSAYHHQQILEKFNYAVNNPPSTISYNFYLEIAEYLRSSFFKNMTAAQGYEELGYQISQVYFQGVSGQVLKTLARVMGPQKAAPQFVRTMQRALPWGIHELKEITENSMTYHKALVGGPPPLMLGILRAAIEVTGVKLIRAEYTVNSQEDDDILYTVEWR